MDGKGTRYVYRQRPDTPLSCVSSTPLWKAAESDREDLVKLLIEGKAHVNIANKYGFPPLFRAKSKGVAQLLIEAKAYINLPSLGVLDTDTRKLSGVVGVGETAVWAAAESDREDVVKLLVERKADVNIPRYGLPPLFRAKSKGVAQLLIGAKADINFQAPGVLDTDTVNMSGVVRIGETAVWAAADSDREDVVKLLVEEKADVNIPHYGLPPLFRAKSRGVVQLLVGAKADINFRAPGTLEAPLSEAVRHIGVVQALLAARADESPQADPYWTRNMSNRSLSLKALQLAVAKERGPSTMVEIPNAAGAKSKCCKRALNILCFVAEMVLLMPMPFAASA